MKLRIQISGLKFRKSDKNLTFAKKARIIKKRLSGGSTTRIRAGDNPAMLEKYLAKRQPVDLEITSNRPKGISTQGKTIKARYVLVVGRRPIPVGEYKEFLEEKGREIPKSIAQRLARGGFIDWKMNGRELYYFCLWLGAKKGITVESPNAFEWQIMEGEVFYHNWFDQHESDMEGG